MEIFSISLIVDYIFNISIYYMYTFFFILLSSRVDNVIRKYVCYINYYFSDFIWKSYNY